MKRLVALAAGLYLAAIWVEVAGQTARPLPGDPLPGITNGDFEEFRSGSKIDRSPSLRFRFSLSREEAS